MCAEIAIDTVEKLGYQVGAPMHVTDSVNPPIGGDTRLRFWHV